MVLDIATVRLKLEFDSCPDLCDTPCFQRVTEDFRGTGTAPYDVIVRISRKPIQGIPSREQAQQRPGYSFFEEDERQAYYFTGSTCMIDPGRRSARISLDPAARPDPLGLTALDTVKLVHSHALMERGGLTLHSAAVERNGTVFLFSGPSKSGKSTIASLFSPAWRILNDEHNFVVPDREGFMVYGSPFMPAERAAYCSPGHGRLFALFRLVQANRNAIVEIPLKRKYLYMVQDTYALAGSASLCESMLGNAQNLCEDAPMANLHFRKDHAIRTMLESIEKGLPDPERREPCGSH